jgi:hypothetical protein
MSGATLLHNPCQGPHYIINIRGHFTSSISGAILNHPCQGSLLVHHKECEKKNIVPNISNNLTCYVKLSIQAHRIYNKDLSCYYINAVFSLRAGYRTHWLATIAYMTLQAVYFQICVSSQWLLAWGLTAYFGNLAFYSISYWEHCNVLRLLANQNSSLDSVQDTFLGTLLKTANVLQLLTGWRSIYG